MPTLCALALWGLILTAQSSLRDRLFVRLLFHDNQNHCSCR